MAHPEYNFTSLLGATVVSVLDAGQSVVTTSAILQNRDDAEVVLPRLDVDITNVSRASTQMMRRSDAWDYPVRYAYNHYRADLVLGIATDRIAAAEDHGALVGSVRYLFSQEAQSFVSPVVTLFEVLSIEETGTSHAVDNDTREDLTQIAYSIEFALKQDGVSPTLSSVTALTSLSYWINPANNKWTITWAPTASVTLQHFQKLEGTDWGTVPKTSISGQLGTYTSTLPLSNGDWQVRVRYHDGSDPGPYTTVVTGTASAI